MRDFNKLTGNSERNAWCIGRAKIDLRTMCLMEPSAQPFITADDFGDRDIAFVADPFRVAAADYSYIFAEGWSRSAQRGQIVVFKLNIHSQIVDSKIALAEQFHLSYPCVFKQGGEYYMLPEAWDSGQLILYKARLFPWEWDRVACLLELDYADPQLFYYKNIYYIFLNTDPLVNATASTFWSESLMGKWRSHPQNPVVNDDLIRARSAGPLVRHAGRIFRFSQDCRLRYGHGVFASEIIELSPSAFRIRPVGWVELDRPAWARAAFHHLNVFRENEVYYALFDGYGESSSQRCNSLKQNSCEEGEE